MRKNNRPLGPNHAGRSPCLERRKLGRRLRLEQLENRSLLAGDDVEMLLPDLTVWADARQNYVYGWTVEAGADQTLLRLATTTANIGTGPIELRGRTRHPDGTQDVWQRMYSSDGSFVDRLAGTFAYHRSHDHIHFEGYAEYNLRAVSEDGTPGDVVATGGKISFCLADIAIRDLSLIGTPYNPRYTSCSSVQGISVGWSDVYFEYLPDQWIDVTHVPPGRYWLEVIVDPDNQLMESDETNNVARTLIEYPPTESLPADRFEPNDSRDGASRLGNDASFQLTDLSIHVPGNDDRYLWTAPITGTLTIEATPIGQPGNMALVLAGSYQLANSISVNDTERVVVSVSRGQEYYVTVYGVDRETIANYRLSFSVIADQGQEVADAYERNDSPARATQLPSQDVVLENLTIHSPADEDYFRWQAPATGKLDVRLLFSNAAGDLDLYLYSQRGFLLGSSIGDDDGEQTTLNVRQGESYMVRVKSRRQATNPQYTLRLDGPRIPGDVNDDGRFDSSDLVRVLAIGEYEDEIPKNSTFEDGDWNDDGEFDSGDLVYAFQAGTYVAEARASVAPAALASTCWASPYWLRCAVESFPCDSP